MFDIHGDTILLRGIPVGTLIPQTVIGYRIDIENTLLDWQDPDGLVTEKDHCKKISEAESESYSEGHDDGLKQGREQAADDAERHAQQRAKAAYADGRADALTDAERARDVARIDALLASLKQAHDALLIFQGIQEPNTYRRRPAKVSECKRAMQNASTTLRFALNTYDRPNGANVAQAAE